MNEVTQAWLEMTYSRKYMRSKIKSDLIKNFSNELESTKKLLADFLAQEFLYSRADRLKHLIDHLMNDDQFITGEELILDILALCLAKEQATIQEVCGAIAPLLKYENNMDGIKMSADLISVISGSNLYYLTKNGDNELIIKSNAKLQKETIIAINKQKYLPPFVCKPKKVISNNDAGFITFKEHVVLKKYNKHDLPINLDVINTQNSIPLCLDLEILEWEKQFKMKEEYKLKTIGQLQEIKDQFKQAQIDAVATYNELLENTDNNFHLVHRYDARGRLYCSGYQVTYQGSDYDKALISINEFEYVEVEEFIN